MALLEAARERPGNDRTRVLFLPGWGFSGQVLELLPGVGHWLAPQALLDPATALADIRGLFSGRIGGPVHLVGWSMGGNLALDFASAFPGQVASLTLVGVRTSWPALEIRAIRQGLLADPVAFLQDFYRKCFLGYRAAQQRFAAELQAELLARLDLPLLERGLDYLAQWRLPAALPGCPVSCWHGRRDVIAPLSEQLCIPQARQRVLEHGGHALFLDREFAA
ncbi:MAG: alpha/beta fold hydrolase [Thermodesulfobacteriota bacterium]